MSELISMLPWLAGITAICIFGAAFIIELWIDGRRYRWLIRNTSVSSELKLKPPPISCPDKLEGCCVAHYGPIPKEQFDAAIDAAS